MKDGIVRQLDSVGSIVIECSCAAECIKANAELAQAIRDCDSSKIHFAGNGCKMKTCQLSIADHGSRCAAWPCDTTSWLIDTDTSKIKQIPTDI